MRDAMFTASILILIICLVRWAFKGRISAKFQYALWGLPALRLILPFSFEPFIKLLWKQPVLTSPYSALSMAREFKEQAIDGTNLQPLVDNVTKGYVYTDPTTDSVLVKMASVDWELILMVLWLAGFVVLTSLMIRNYRLFSKMLTEKRELLYKENADGFVYPVYVVEGLKSPCLFRIIGQEPAVYVTPHVAEDEEKLRHVRVHEEMHGRHKDLYWSELRTTLLCMYWMNPLVWLAALLSKRDCELACDEAALEFLGEEERFAYGKTLVSLIAEKTSALDVLTVATTMTGSKKSIKERVQMLTKRKNVKAWITGLVAVIAVIAVAFTFAGKEEKKEILPEAEGTEDFAVLSDEEGTTVQAEVEAIEHEPVQRPDWGINMTVENISPTGLTIVCIQSEVEVAGELFTGSDYSLQRYENGEWVAVEYLPQEHEVAWTSEAWIIPLNDAVKWDVDWEWLYGELPSGTYQITKGVMNLQEPGKFESATYSVKFEL